MKIKIVWEKVKSVDENGVVSTNKCEELHIKRFNELTKEWFDCNFVSGPQIYRSNVNPKTWNTNSLPDVLSEDEFFPKNKLKSLIEEAILDEMKCIFDEMISHNNSM